MSRMTEKRYLKRMKQHQVTINRTWRKMADETNQFIDDNPDIVPIDTRCTYRKGWDVIEHFIDDLGTKAAWIQDRLNNKYPSDRGAMTKKIRAVLGFTYP